MHRELARIGHHRGPSPIDILIALTARQHRLTVLHVDDDFAAIAKVCPDIGMLRLQPVTG
ncbi:PIN domain-containing protein [Streptomyces atroolivaceus]|uniref:PIN domain-containing protein n=1 Tax=Streptomyces atroolivaceus TaxID=66869 RepID=UPI00362E43C0